MVGAIVLSPTDAVSQEVVVGSVQRVVAARARAPRGDNTFKLPHLHKQTAARRGASIVRALPCSEEAWLKAHE